MNFAGCVPGGCGAIHSWLYCLVDYVVIPFKKKNLSSILAEPWCSFSFFWCGDWVNNAFIGIDNSTCGFIFNNKYLLEQQKLYNGIIMHTCNMPCLDHGFIYCLKISIVIGYAFLYLLYICSSFFKNFLYNLCFYLLFDTKEKYRLK